MTPPSSVPVQREARDDGGAADRAGLTAHVPGRTGWWERYRGSLPHGLPDIAETEASAVRIRGANTVHVPGMLQTSDHAVAIFRAVVPALPDHEIALRLALRSQRQEVITRDAPMPYVAVVHEAALRMQFGGRRVARAQLENLLEISERENVALLALPFDRGSFPGAGQTVVYTEGPVPQLGTVKVDNSHGPVFLHTEDARLHPRDHTSTVRNTPWPTSPGSPPSVAKEAPASA